MKSLFYSSLLLAGSVAVANAQSLYSIASPVGLEESVPLNYRADVSFGYDDNVNATSGSLKQDSSYIRVGVGASMSSWDARTQYSFDAQIGGIFYLESMKFGTNDVMSDSTFRANLVHNLDSRVRYTASVGVSYMPEPDYSSGINVSSRAGEYLYAFFDNAISKAWTPRFSTSTGFNVSTLYYNDDYAKIDNRDYYRLNQSFRYKWTERAAASLTWRGEYADRRYGTDALNNFVMAGYEYALTQYTNIAMNVGPQFKHTSNTGTNATVYAELGLNHKLTDRSNLNFFFRREDESTNTYQSGANYGSNISYRVGVNAGYKLNHVWTATAGINYVESSYRRPQQGLTNRETNVWNLSLGLNYQATRNLAIRFSYSYTDGKNSSMYAMNNSYHRNIYAVGAYYTF